MHRKYTSGYTNIYAVKQWTSFQGREESGRFRRMKGEMDRQQDLWNYVGRGFRLQATVATFDWAELNSSLFLV